MSNDEKLHGSAVRGPSGLADSSAPLVTLTAKAVEMLRDAMRREGVAQHGIRVGVVAGGCSGLEYHLAFEPHPRRDDAVVDIDGLQIFMDAVSQEHLQGVTIDYVTGLHAAGFKFLNPNATRTCGCGSSFAT